MPQAAKSSSPRARRVARELGVDWTALRGSGKTGRIRERDVRAAAGPGISQVRKTIAERMLLSAHSTAPVTLTTTADATKLVEIRQALKPTNARVPSYTDFLITYVALALREHPRLNSRWDGERLVEQPDIHVGFAVDTDAGLLVPVICNVASLTIQEITQRTSDLARRARDGKLKGDEMRGGTFTITNLGAFGIDAFTPIINYPECAILGVGRIVRQAVVVGNDIAIRDIMTLSLTFDHRIVDGAPAARFLQRVVQLIEAAE
jgi:pyruvate dehydrogenase E2 component (dihydrolipoamide acetyltransferase)